MKATDRANGAGTPTIGYVWDVPTDLSDKRVQKRLSPSALKAFFNIVAKWKLKDEDARQLLGGVSSGAYYKLKAGGKRELDQDELTRVSLLIGMYKALNIIFEQKLASVWMQLPNQHPLFAGASPLAYMIQFGQPGMQRVRQLLDARRGGR
jgi:uncharacterized protein (DUF2384 family)